MLPELLTLKLLSLSTPVTLAFVIDLVFGKGEVLLRAELELLSTTF